MKRIQANRTNEPCGVYRKSPSKTGKVPLGSYGTNSWHFMATKGCPSSLSRFPCQEKGLPRPLGPLSLLCYIRKNEGAPLYVCSFVFKVGFNISSGGGEEVTLLSENLFSDSLVLWDEIYIHLAQLAALILPHCTAPSLPTNSWRRSFC